jgi:hypothetical protein
LSRGAKIVIFLLFVLVILSLALNGYGVWQLLIFREQALALQQRIQDLQQVALETVSHTITELETFDQATIQYTAQINDQIPVQAVVPFQENLQVPIQATIPISEEISTTVAFEISQLGLSIPVDITFPLVLDVPVDITVPIDIDHQVPVSTTVPIRLKVPIVVKLSETDLGRYVELLKQELKDLEQALSVAQE